jgi:hypothetical protein
MRLQLGEAEAGLEALDRALGASKRILAEIAEDAPNFRRGEERR